jgi:drug/metabolite transporter (DMT)-like permease
MTIYLGIALAFVCAFTTNLAFLYKHRGAVAAPTVHVRHPIAAARGLFGSRWFAVGMLVAIVAWVFHVGALALAPLSVVQVVLAGGVVMLAVMAERIFGFKVGPRQWLGLGLTGAGLVLLGLTLPAVHDPQSQFSLPGMIAFEAGLVAVGGLLVMGKRIGAPDHHHGVMLAAAAGLLFGVSDVALKALTGLVADDGVLSLLTSPWTAVAIAASIAAFYASAKALQEGEAVPVIAFTGTAANVAGIAGGIVVFGDPLPGDVLGIVAQALAFLLVIVAAALTPAPVRAAQPGAATA